MSPGLSNTRFMNPLCPSTYVKFDLINFTPSKHLIFIRNPSPCIRDIKSLCKTPDTRCTMPASACSCLRISSFPLSPRLAQLLQREIISPLSHVPALVAEVYPSSVRVEYVVLGPAQWRIYF